MKINKFKQGQVVKDSALHVYPNFPWVSPPPPHPGKDRVTTWCSSYLRHSSELSITRALRGLQLNVTTYGNIWLYFDVNRIKVRTKRQQNPPPHPRWEAFSQKKDRGLNMFTTVSVRLITKRPQYHKIPTLFCCQQKKIYRSLVFNSKFNWMTRKNIEFQM